MALRPESYSSQPPNVGYYPKYHWKLITATILGAISVAVVAIVVSLTPVYIGKNDKTTEPSAVMSATYTASGRNVGEAQRSIIEALYKSNLNAYSARAINTASDFRATVTWLTLRNYRDLEALYYSQVYTLANSTLSSSGTLTFNSLRVIAPGSTGDDIQTCINSGTAQFNLICTTYSSGVALTVTAQIAKLPNTVTQTLTAANTTAITDALGYIFELSPIDATIATASISDSRVLSAKLNWVNSTLISNSQSIETILTNMAQPAGTILLTFNYTITNFTALVTVNGTSTYRCFLAGQGNSQRPFCSPLIITTTRPTTTTTVAPTTTISLKNVVQATVTNAKADLPSSIVNLGTEIEKAVNETGVGSNGNWVPDTPTSTLYKLSLELVYGSALDPATTGLENVKKVVETVEKTVKTQIGVDNDLEATFRVSVQKLEDMSAGIVVTNSSGAETNCELIGGNFDCSTTTTTSEPTTKEPEEPKPTTKEPEEPKPTTKEPEEPKPTTKEPENPKPTTEEDPK